MDITKYFQRSERQRIDSQIIESLPLASSSSALEEEEIIITIIIINYLINGGSHSSMNN